MDKLTNDISPYLKRLLIDYKSSDNLLYNILQSSVMRFTNAVTQYDFGEEYTSYSLELHLPEDILSKINIPKEKEYKEKIKKDLTECTDLGYSVREFNFLPKENKLYENSDYFSLNSTVKYYENIDSIWKKMI